MIIKSICQNCQYFSVQILIYYFTIQQTILEAEAQLLQGTLQINFTKNYQSRFYVSLGDNYEQISRVYNQTDQIMNIEICPFKLVEDPVKCYETLYRTKNITIIFDIQDGENDYTFCIATINYRDNYFSNCQVDQNIKKHQLIFTYTAIYFNKENDLRAYCYSDDYMVYSFKADKMYQQNQFITVKYDCNNVDKKNRNKCIQNIQIPFKGCNFKLTGQFDDQTIQYLSQYIPVNNNMSKTEL